MRSLLEAVAHIALEVHPDRIEAVCGALTSLPNRNFSAVLKTSLGSNFSPRLLEGFARAIQEFPEVNAAELTAIFRAAAATAEIATQASSSELVWTGPGSGLVPVRHTEQVMTDLITEAVSSIFVVSFVAYDVLSVLEALTRAITRGVAVRALLERSQAHGGTVSLDSFAMMRAALPQARLYFWDRDTGAVGLGASVHAKCVVADSDSAFITSANLSNAAMERNMELGVLIRGGPLPSQLERHLLALINTKHLKEA